MQIVSIVIQSWLLLWMGYVSVGKIVGEKNQVALFESIRLSQRFRVVTGFVQLIGCAGLIIGYWYPGIAGWAGAWLSVIMLAACLSHVRVKHSFSKFVPALVTLALSIAVLLLFAEDLANPLN